MNINQWISQLTEAYQSVGKSLSPEKKTLLFAELSETSPQLQKELVAEASDIMIRFFFRKASRSETFGSLSRVKDKFGETVEENYGLSSGPFINMAKTYWTYKIEVNDLAREHYKTALFKMLKEIEINIAGTFFPTSGPSNMPVSLRIKAQRQLLEEYAPDMDVERFLTESPILKTSTRRTGCLGTIILFVLILIALSIAFWSLLT